MITIQAVDFGEVTPGADGVIRTYDKAGLMGSARRHSGLLAFYNFKDALNLGADIADSANDSGVTGLVATASHAARTDVVEITSGNKIDLVSHIPDFQSQKDVSISAWVYVSSAGNSAIAAFTNGTQSSTEWLLFTASGSLVFQVRIFGASEFKLETGANISNGWHHVVASTGLSGPKVWIDKVYYDPATYVTQGSAVSTASFDTINITSAGFGSSTNSDSVVYPMEGYLDDVVLYPYQLDQATVSDIYDNDRYGYEVYPLAGQSNMIGRASVRGGIDDNYTLISGQVFQFGFDAQSISAATNSLDHVNESSSDAGMWKTMCEGLIDNSPYKKKMLVVPVAEGGTGFKTNHWNQGDARYNAAIASINAALAINKINVLNAFLWHQGETDGDNASTSYLADITAFYSAIQSDITQMTASIPVVVGSPANVTGNRIAIDTDLIAFAEANPAVAYVDTKDLVLQDASHFDAPSLAMIGTRYAGAL